MIKLSRLELREMMKRAHYLTRQYVERLGVDYRTQLGICMKFIYREILQRKFNLYKNATIKEVNEAVEMFERRIHNCWTDDIERKYHEIKNNLSNKILGTEGVGASGLSVKEYCQVHGGIVQYCFTMILTYAKNLKEKGLIY